MDFDRARTGIEIAWIRVRAHAHTGLRVVGIALVLLAVFNMYGVAFTDHTAFAPYRPFVTDALELGFLTAYVADLLVLGVGLILAWWG